MKKYLFVFLSCLMVGMQVFSQTSAPETLLDLNNPERTQSEIKMTYSGTPAVLIEKPNQKKGPMVNPADYIPPPELPKENVKISIKTPYGHPQTAAYLDHTTDFNVIVQLLDDETIRVEEQIQIVNTRDSTPFQRVLSKKMKAQDGRLISAQIQPLSVFADDMRARVDIREDDETLTLSFHRDLSPGVHNFTIQYLVRGIVRTEVSGADIFLSLTGYHWPLMVERFSLVVLTPKKGKFNTKELLFGTNNQFVGDMFSVKTDPSGALVYQLKHPLPAYADIRLHLVVDKNVLIPADGTRAFKSSYTAVVLGTYTLVMIFYTVLSVGAVRRHKWKKPMKQSRRFNPLLWGSGMGLTFTPQERDDIVDAIHLSGQKRGASLLARMPVILRVLSFIWFNIEYILGMTLLMILVPIIARHYHVDLWTGVKDILVVISLFCLFVIDYFGTRVMLTRLRNALRHEMTDTPQGINMAGRDIMTYYLMATCLKFGAEWRSRLIQNNPAYQSVFEKGENS